METEQHQWKSTVALITGGTAGIGRTLVDQLASLGCTVVTCGRDTTAVNALNERIQAQGWRGFARQVDLRSEKAILSLFGEIRSRYGGVNVLVNNAGLGHEAPLTHGDTSLWREMLDVNVLALCICTREAITDMRADGDRGHIIHISSMAGHRNPGGSGVYSATKFAVRSLTEGLRRELRAAKSQIRIGSVSPGYVETRFAARYSKSEEAAREVYSSMDVIQPEDVANTVTFMLSQPNHVQIHDILMRPTEQVT